MFRQLLMKQCQSFLSGGEWAVGVGVGIGNGIGIGIWTGVVVIG